MTLVTGYSIKLRNAVIQRWQELEQQVAQPKIEFTLEQALQIALDKERENKQLTDINTRQAEKLEADAPKVKSFQALMDSDGMFSNAVAAKSVGAGVKRLLGRLRAHDHVFRHNALPKQHLIDQGLCKVVTNKEGYSSIRWTPKGLDWVTKFYAESSKARPNRIVGELPFMKRRAVPMTKRFH
jgi:phage antirepressor YoqD-like protein